MKKNVKSICELSITGFIIVFCLTNNEVFMLNVSPGNISSQYTGIKSALSIVVRWLWFLINLLLGG